MTNRSLSLSLLGLFLVVFSGAFMQNKAFAEDVYKVGAVFSLTGRGSLLGTPEKKTVRMLEQDLNERGGINGKRVKVIIYNDDSEPERAASLVRELIEEDNVLAVIGPSLSGPSLESVPVAEEMRTPLISCAASHKIVTADRETGKQYEWVFKTAQSDSHAVGAIFSHMKKKAISRVAILAAETGFGISGRDELIRLAPAFGINIIAVETYGPRETSMLSYFSRIKDLDYHAIVNWSIGPTQIVALHHWRNLGLSVKPFYQSHGFGSPRNIAIAGNAAEGVYCPLGACNVAEILPANNPQKEVVMSYRNAYTRKYDEPISSFGGHAWDAFSLLIEALDAVGPDKEKIREYLEYKKGFVGQHGIFNFSPIDHNGLSWEDFVMVVVRDGDWALAE